MSTKSRKIDKGSVLDFGGLGFTDDALMGGLPSSLSEPLLDQPIRNIKLKDIRQGSPFQTRQSAFDPQAHPQDEELLESVRVNGVLEPIMVLDLASPGGPRDYQIVFGHRRVAAARIAGLKDITAIITQDVEEARILTLAENMGGRELTPYEKALAIARLKDAHPDLSVRALGQKTGIPFQTVSTLLRAYSDSPPALRGMFAKGLSAGAVLELNPVFASTAERKHASMARDLQGSTRRQAQRIRTLVEGGAAPQDAIRSALAAEVRQNVSPSQPPEPGSERDRSKAARSTPKHLTPLPSVSDREAIEEICEFTGASKAKVKRLIELAGYANVRREVLIFACAYNCSRNEEGEALQFAKAAYQDPGTRMLIHRFLRLRVRARKQIQAVGDPRIGKFTNKVIFGA